MIKQPLYLNLATITLALSLDLFTSSPILTQAQIQTTPSNQPENNWRIGEGSTSAYEPPPDIGSPRRTESGSTRPTLLICTKPYNPTLTAFIPKNTDGALTVESHPTFFAYLPPNAGETVEFALQDLDYRDIYRIKFPFPKTSGIISFKLPNTVPDLEVGKTYRWTISIICPAQKDGFREEHWVSAKIGRIELRPPIATELQKLQPRDRAKFYQQYKIWHEALTTLAELRLVNPDNSQLNTEWKQLLDSAGLSEFSELPMVTILKFP